MGILRSQTTRNITAPSPREQDVKMGITRSATDPISEESHSRSHHHHHLLHHHHHGEGSSSSSPPSGHASGTSSPRRKTASMDIMRNVRDRPSSAIPKFHLLAEQLHRFKMRKCEGMQASAEEKEGIREMKRWNWKSCGHPGESPLPIGPMNETLRFDAESEGLGLVPDEKR